MLLTDINQIVPDSYPFKGFVIGREDSVEQINRGETPDFRKMKKQQCNWDFNRNYLSCAE